MSTGGQTDGEQELTEDSSPDEIMAALRKASANLRAKNKKLKKKPSSTNPDQKS